jgi:hypothetical protein
MGEMPKTPEKKPKTLAADLVAFGTKLNKSAQKGSWAHATISDFRRTPASFVTRLARMSA